MENGLSVHSISNGVAHTSPKSRSIHFSAIDHTQMRSYAMGDFKLEVLKQPAGFASLDILLVAEKYTGSWERDMSEMEAIARRTDVD